jgi:hypothetical protein
MERKQLEQKCLALRDALSELWATNRGGRSLDLLPELEELAPYLSEREYVIQLEAIYETAAASYLRDAKRGSKGNRQVWSKGIEKAREIIAGLEHRKRGDDWQTELSQRAYVGHNRHGVPLEALRSGMGMTLGMSGETILRYDNYLPDLTRRQRGRLQPYIYLTEYHADAPPFIFQSQVEYRRSGWFSPEQRGMLADIWTREDGRRAKDLFAKELLLHAVDAFDASGRVEYFVAKWLEGAGSDNFARYQRAYDTGLRLGRTQVEAGQDAARQTWTYEVVRQRGFAQVEKVGSFREEKERGIRAYFLRQSR